MKLKCPACAKVLEVSNAAAGKIVKCPCGTQIRAPQAVTASGGGATGKPLPNRPVAPNRPAAPSRPVTANRPVAPSRPVAPNRPIAPNRPVTAGPSVDSAFLDELTDGDLQPLAVASVAGRTPKVAASSGHATNPYATLTAEANGDATAASNPSKRPGTLILLAVMNIFGVFFYGLITLATSGIAAAMPMMEDQVQGGLAGWALLLVAGGAGLYTLFCLLTAVSCFVRHWACWAFMLFAYAFSGGEYLFEVAKVIAREEGTVFRLIQRALFVFCVMAYLHQEEPRRFYGTLQSGKKISSIADITGFILGAALGAAIFFATENAPELP